MRVKIQVSKNTGYDRNVKRFNSYKDAYNYINQQPKDLQDIDVVKNNFANRQDFINKIKENNGMFTFYSDGIFAGSCYFHVKLL